MASLRRARLGLRQTVPAVVVLTATALCAPMLAGSATAAPSLTLGQAQHQLAALQHRAEVASQAFDGATVSLASLTRKEQASAAALARDRAALTATQTKVATAATAAYRNGTTVSPALTILSTGSTASAVARSESLAQIERSQAQQIADVAAQQRAVSGAEAVNAAQVREQRAVVARVTAQKHQVEQLISAQQAVIGRLKASARRALVAQQVASHRQAVAQRSTYTGPATGSASAAIRFAYAQLGKPYVWGAVGPGSYDCSGLTMQSWAAAGVALPRTAAAQQSALPSVSMSALQPGDLVFFGDPAYHVALYIGGGRIIQAPYTGADVQIASMGSPTSAGRP